MTPFILVGLLCIEQSLCTRPIPVGLPTSKQEGLLSLTLSAPLEHQDWHNTWGLMKPDDQAYETGDLGQEDGTVLDDQRIPNMKGLLRNSHENGLSGTRGVRSIHPRSNSESLRLTREWLSATGPPWKERLHYLQDPAYGLPEESLVFQEGEDPSHSNPNTPSDEKNTHLRKIRGKSDPRAIPSSPKNTHLEEEENIFFQKRRELAHSRSFSDADELTLQDLELPDQHTQTESLLGDEYASSRTSSPSVSNRDSPIIQDLSLKKSGPKDDDRGIIFDMDE
eukprot:g2716.t1